MIVICNTTKITKYFIPDLQAFNGQFFNSVNPGIGRYQSRDYGIGEFGRDPGIAIPNLMHYSYAVRIDNCNCMQPAQPVISISEWLTSNNSQGPSL